MQRFASMEVTAAAIAIVVSFALFAYAASLGSRASALAARAEVLLLLPASAFGAFFALVVMAMSCDESCYGDGWTHESGAWQWYFQFALALCGFLMNGAAAAAALQRRWSWATIWVLAGVGLFLGWAMMLAPLGNAFGI